MSRVVGFHELELVVNGNRVEWKIFVQDSTLELVESEVGSRMLRDYEVSTQCFTEKQRTILGNDFVQVNRVS